MEFVIFWYGIALVVYGLTYVLPVFLADKNKTLTRKPYAIRAIAWFVFTAVLIPVFLPDGGEVTWSVAMVIAIIFLANAFLVLWPVHRTQDMGVSKWWCLVLALPAINLVSIVALMFTRSASSKPESSSSPATPKSTDVGNG